ncbi:biopolymer transporter ExbD [Pedobacter yulinensis]|uniref:Biopolymer transporter ExbD n=1 Tax=Pedobacter yulinensis TaxID=2126353 RepID=A0A2T3HGZ4_9SPHI|nr:biopolymer transporter ExbD [Pedobacter yulinensis]PST81707.1 biopolymer transporter ExbD [Pedobacter yulinensis]
MNFRKRQKGTVEVNTSALNDIMFFLLLFFLLASAVANPEVVKLLLPRSQSGEQLVAKKTITVSIDENKNYFIEKQPVSVEELQSKIESYTKEAQELTIILYVYRDIPTETTIQIIDIANKAKAKLVLAVEPKK